MRAACLLLQLAVLAFHFLPTTASAQGQTTPSLQWTPASLIDAMADILNTHKGDDAREPPLGALLAEAEAYLDGHRDSPAAWSVTARIRFWYADTRSLVPGLSLMAQARDELLAAIDIDPRALEGNAQALLGFMYFAVPPWPVSFRSRRKSDDYFQEALAISETSLANNYLYAQVLLWQKRYPDARRHLDLARESLEKAAQPAATRILYQDGIDNMLRQLANF